MFVNWNAKIKIVLCLLASIIFNQASFCQAELNLRLKAKPAGVIYHRTNQYLGSELLFNDWQTGEIIMNNGQSIDHLQLNYNALTDALLYNIPGNTVVEVARIQLDRFRITQQNSPRVFILSSRDTVLSKYFDVPTFIELLHEGRVRLVAQRAVKINNQLVHDNPFNKSVFYTNDTYFVMVDGELIASPQRIKSYLDYFAKPDIKNILRQGNLSLKTESDLIFFVEELSKLSPVKQANQTVNNKITPDENN